jgi:hypothetical protein
LNLAFPNKAVADDDEIPHSINAVEGVNSGREEKGLGHTEKTDSLDE